MPTAPSSAQCNGDKGFIPGKSTPWRWTLPLEAHVHIVQLGSAVQTKKRQRFREGEIPGNAKSVVLYCLHKADVLLAPEAIHHFGVTDKMFCWAPAAVKESSSPQGHRYTINTLFTKTKCSWLAVLQSLVIKVIYLYEAFRFFKSIAG